MTPEAGPLLLRRLERARRRWAFRSLLRGLAWTAAASAVAATAFVLYDGVRPGAGGSGLAVWMMIAAGCTVAGGLLTLARVAFGRPALVEMARMADTRFGLQERLATALEARAKGSAGALTAALWRDAEDHAERVRPRTLVPIRPTPSYVALWTFAVGTFAFMLLWGARPSASAEGSGPPPADVVASEAMDIDETAVKLRRVAQLASRGRSEVSDSRLREFVRDVERLEASLAGGGADPREVGAQLDRLLADASRLFGGAGEGRQSGGGDRTGRTGGGYAPGADGNDGRVSGQEPTPAGEEALRAEDGQLGTGAAAPPAPEERRLTLDLLLERLESDVSMEAEAAPEGTESASLRAAQGDLEQLEWEDESATEAILDNLQRMRTEQGRREGTFADRADAAGDGTAGRSTQALEQGAAAPLGAGRAARREEIALPSERVAQGGTITLEAPPDVREALVESPPASVGDWTPATEALHSGEAIFWRHRAAVRDYFLPGATAEGEAP